MENTQVLEESELTAYHSCLWTKRYKTVICTKNSMTAQQLHLQMRIHQTIDDWELWDKIADLCFDTTALNTGAKGGECKWMEQKVERNHIHLAFRHHISELILAHAFSLHDVPKPPNIEIFTRFKKY